MIGLSRGLPVDFGEHDVGLDIGEKTLATNWRQLAGIAQHQDRLLEFEQIECQILADHGHFIEHDQCCVACDAILVELETRPVCVRELHLEACKADFFDPACGWREA